MRSLADRFNEKYVVHQESGCWLWAAYVDKKGYGHIGSGPPAHTVLGAHRVSYELHKGAIPEGLYLDHLCRNPSCVNPAHLEAVTHAENIRRGMRATQTHCKNGHEFSAANTIRRGQRFCRTCHNLETKLYKRKKRAEAKAAAT